MSARDFSTRGRRRAWDAMDLGLLGIAALTLLLAGYATGTSWADLRRTRQHVEDARRQAQVEQQRLRALESRRPLEGPLANQAVLTADAPPPRLVADLGLLLPADVRLESLTLTYGDGIAVEMTVSARASGAYDAFLQRLEGSPLFEDVIPGEETRGAGAQASVHARYRPLGPAGGSGR